MTPHERRLEILATALLIRDPTQVVQALRSKDVLYFGASGALLLATGPEWSDERLVRAAVELFVDDTTDAAPGGH